MTDHRQPLDELLDLLVFAPLGLAAVVQEHLPDLVGKGRERWASQATMAKVVGEFAVAQGRKETAKVVRRAGGLFSQVAGHHRPGSSAAPTPTEGSASGPAEPAPAPTAPRRAARVATAGAADALAIPGYDALSAPQVVSRLDGLSSDELEAVRAYEELTRGRKTILGRVAQLQALLD